MKITVLKNCHIYTLNGSQPTATSIAVESDRDGKGRVLALADSDNLEAEFGGIVSVKDMRGKTILPGLCDAHTHLLNYARFQDYIDCDTPTMAECLDRVRQKAAQSQPGEWIRGHGWRQAGWPEGFGNAGMLDEAAPHNPVYLTAASLHAAWANSSALRAAGVRDDSSDPPKGQIQRDEDGVATGILFEEAMGLVSEVIPKPSHAKNIEDLIAAQERLWSLGLTSVHDFDRSDSFRALQDLHNQGQLRLRILKSIPVERLEEAAAVGLRSGFGDEMLRIGAIKAFADGALGPRTAAMLEAYEGEPENRGMLLMDGEEVLEAGQKAAQAGFGMAVHAIGDRANHEVLNAMEQLRDYEQENGLPARRHRIEHVQILHPDDVPRLAQLNIAASMQPIHATSDMEAADAAWGERAQYSYGWGSQAEAGALLVFGSDAPVESPNPFLGLHAAVTRRKADGSPGGEGWRPEQRLSLQQALEGFTHGPAQVAGWEDEVGKLAPGFMADLIVLDDDPYQIDANEIRNLKTKATMVGGDWVWQG